MAIAAPPDLRARIARMPLEQVKAALDELDPQLPTKYVPHRPTPPQQAFLLLDPFLEVLYGGAAGGGKSDALLMAALRYVTVPGYAALLLRRTFTDLSLPGALIPRSHEWLHDTDARWDDQEHAWRFPNPNSLTGAGGATITFGYLDSKLAHLRYQSAEFQYVGFDELTQFEEHQYRYLFSRTRRPSDGPLSRVPARVRGATNPQPPGIEWVARRWGLDRGDPRNPKAFDRPVFTRDDDTKRTRAFVPAKLEDNPHLDRDEYMLTLMELDPLTRARLRAGLWVIGQQGNIINPGWLGDIRDTRPRCARWVRYWDLAATESASGTDPDYTAGALMGGPIIGESSSNPLLQGPWCLAHMARFRASPGKVEATIKQVAEIDGPGVTIVLEQEPGASGKLVGAYMKRVLAGYNVKVVPKRKSKVEAAGPFASQAEAGNIALVRGEWVGPFLDEAGAFPLGSHDDMMDAASGAFGELVGRTARKGAYSW